MKINIESTIRNKYMVGFPRDYNDVTEIVCHGTGGGQSARAIMSWMLGGERKDLYMQGIGLFHYLIDFNGDIYEIINSLNWTYHSEAGAQDKHTIGIELMNPMFGNQGTYKNEQYKALQNLILELLEMFPNINSIVSHDANRKKYSGLPPKPCPGKFFEWAKIEEIITENASRTITIERG